MFVFVETVLACTSLPVCCIIVFRTDDSAELQNDKVEFLPVLFVTPSTKSDLFF